MGMQEIDREDEQRAFKEMMIKETEGRGYASDLFAAEATQGVAKKESRGYLESICVWQVFSAPFKFTPV